MVVRMARAAGRMRPRRSFDQDTIVPHARERGALGAVLADVFSPSGPSALSLPMCTTLKAQCRPSSTKLQTHFPKITTVMTRQLALEAQSKAALLCGSTLVMRISTLSQTLDELETCLDRIVKSASEELAWPLLPQIPHMC